MGGTSMTRSFARAFGHALLLCAALPLAAAAQAPASASPTPAPVPTATPGPPQIAFPGQYALAPADWRFPGLPSSLPPGDGGQRLASPHFVASHHRRRPHVSPAHTPL